MIVASEFRPHAWLCNPHVQTVLASRLAVPDRPEVERERMELDDGDFLDLAYSRATKSANGSAHASTSGFAPGSSWEPARRLAGSHPIAEHTGGSDNRPIVALFHGLAGSLDSAYARGAITTLNHAGFDTCLMHWRGCSGEPNRLARSYHSGASDDIGRVIDLLHGRQPQRTIYAVGFSLGGNALLKYLGERGDDTPLAGALSVSPPLVLAIGAEQLDRGFARIYRGHLLSLMRAQHEAKRQLRPELGLASAGPELDTFRKFDDTLTAPLHGYAGVDDYYARCSARAWLGTIERPTHILCARDDPFFTEAILPDASELTTSTTLELSRHGGHVGFLASGARLRPYRWLDDRVAEVMVGFTKENRLPQ